eukprot:GILJ01006786.1.p1 GENE.GILJ01006786.1~~GILJ01006786.1.p1  ORF type:complete len:544 (-),score=52.46 GILJ01006786.1:30-1661(-)
MEVEKKQSLMDRFLRPKAAAADGQPPSATDRSPNDESKQKRGSSLRSPPARTAKNDICLPVSRSPVTTDAEMRTGTATHRYALRKMQRRQSCEDAMETPSGVRAPKRHRSETSQFDHKHSPPFCGCSNLPALEESDENSSSQLSEVLVGVVSQKGGRAVNQDAFSSCVLPAGSNYPSTHIFGVFDGHGSLGAKAASVASELLPAFLRSDPDLQNDLDGVLYRSFDKTQEKLKKMGTRDKKDYGTTAVLAVLQGNVLTVANTGDSRAIIGRCVSSGAPSPSPRTQTAIPFPTPSASAPAALSADRVQSSTSTFQRMSHEHTLSRDDERQRVCESGGAVIQATPSSSLLRCIPGNMTREQAKAQGLCLSMSRALGHYILAEHGVWHRPDIVRRALQPIDNFLVIASDGVWDVMSNEEVVGMVSAARNPQEAAHTLVKECLARWHKMKNACDNVTALVVYFRYKAQPKSAGYSANHVDLSTSSSQEPAKCCSQPLCTCSQSFGSMLGPDGSLLITPTSSLTVTSPFCSEPGEEVEDDLALTQTDSG